MSNNDEHIDIETTARIAHEVNRAYCRSIGDFSQLPWDDAPTWQKESARNGVAFIRGNKLAGPGDSHRSWLKEKIDNGWTFGIVKDAEKKRHPCMVPFEGLPHEQQVKDWLFCGVVRAIDDMNEARGKKEP
jgi:hypothetical protein